ncbi:hypothetical protein CU044_0869 [Streptomyces sp. L-9-10]|uniref:hypothetical protein n=1 Tax=Streptomyces sp. L-9-10 TaxID=1478131 RepID=UPI00101CA634|nr:hypothetical protein [Streptomyces sp. L-9-10]RYJ30819.1 hypothetical protein CU044_0869 [Streptomyces sp. L-9-10]
MASPGYGKRSTPGQQARSADAFAHLPPREAAVAAFVDRLPEGTDISVKALAKVLPYGQCALRTALRRLQVAGHLRRGKEHLSGPDGMRWVTRTWFSRTARDNDWWAAFVSGDLATADARANTSDPPTRSRAFILLAALGRSAPVMSLSAADCAALEPLTTPWFERGATERDILHALTAGLPAVVHHPAALARVRLTSKLPPERIRAPRPPLRVLECAKCGAPGRPEALTDGECGPCRGEPAPVRPPGPLPPTKVHALAAQARAAATRPPERIPT